MTTPKVAAAFVGYLTACGWFTLLLTDGWSVLAITVATVTLGGAIVIGFLALCALQAQRERYRFHAWRHQLEAPPQTSIDADSW